MVHRCVVAVGGASNPSNDRFCGWKVVEGGWKDGRGLSSLVLPNDPVPPMRRRAELFVGDAALLQQRVHGRFEFSLLTLPLRRSLATPSGRRSLKGR
jgi:hypothetical protein